MGLASTDCFFELRFESIEGLGTHGAGQILATVAVLRMGLNAAQFSSYGSEKKGSLVRSFVRLRPAGRPVRTSAPVDDASGRRRPLPIPDSEFVLPVDNVVLAIATTPNPLLTRTTAGLATTDHGCLVADEVTGQTSRPLVYAGGDAVMGAATVILAAGPGKRAAQAIDAAFAERRAVGLQ